MSPIMDLTMVEFDPKQPARNLAKQEINIEFEVANMHAEIIPKNNPKRRTHLREYLSEILPQTMFIKNKGV